MLSVRDAVRSWFVVVDGRMRPLFPHSNKLGTMVPSYILHGYTSLYSALLREPVAHLFVELASVISVV